MKLKHIFKLVNSGFIRDEREVLETLEEDKYKLLFSVYKGTTIRFYREKSLNFSIKSN